jgi:uncharacterized membrane protein
MNVRYVPDAGAVSASPGPARLIVSGTAMLLIVAGLGVYLRLPGFHYLWVWPDPDPIAIAFVGTWLVSGSAGMLWVGLSGNLTALRPLMLTLIVAFAGASAHLLWYANASLTGTERYRAFSLVLASAIAAAVAALLWSRRQEPRADGPVPGFVPPVFVLFAAILLFAGGSMALGFIRVFPVPLRADVAAVCGWFFIGSAAYFVYGVARPSRLNGVGQLVSFAVYDLLLIPPFLLLLPNVDPAHRTSLIVYLGVLIVSMLFSVYCLVFDRRMRLQWSGERSQVTASG